MQFDEFIISFDLNALLFLKSQFICRRTTASRCRFSVFVLATFPEYVPRFCRGTLGIPSKTLNVYICDVCLTWFHVMFRKPTAKEKEQSFIEQLKLKTFISFLKMYSYN